MKTDSVVIFGTGRLSSLSWYALTHDSDCRVEAFTVERDLVGSGWHEGLPVIPFDELAERYPPAQIDLHIPLGYQRINELRRARYLQAQAMGYRFAGYISSRASVSAEARIGANCLIYENAVIEAGAVIGDDVIIRCGARVGARCEVASHAFIAGHAHLGAEVRVGEQAFVGVGAVARDGIALGARSFSGAGAGLLANTEPDSVYIGNPARRVTGTSLDVTS
jgi:sugar O-acyltransferase (sialic acid O-acetyltransferase NeuD family)